MVVSMVYKGYKYCGIINQWFCALRYRINSCAKPANVAVIVSIAVSVNVINEMSNDSSAVSNFYLFTTRYVGTYFILSISLFLKKCTERHDGRRVRVLHKVLS